ncbi:MAG: branched-chain alpha-keto acid dehydrogenase subunit [Dactylosporangium sp.]|jgi:2-oxoisovalerate dehydrogenase E2 component (dihydrolipoyl transacylase)|nr:branched-chain alpha-keto acid dehydrogenase subunit [Dactylosporangium sp.]
MSRIKEFPLPDLGEGLAEGEILKWLVSVGDTIELNQPIVEVETAKAAVEIPAKWAGQVSAIFHAEGETVEVGTPIIAIDTDPTAGPIEQHSGSNGSATRTPSAAALAAVEIAPQEGAVEPGLIGGPAPGGRTAVLVGYGPKNTVAARRPRATSPAPQKGPLSPPQRQEGVPPAQEGAPPAQEGRIGVDRPLAKPPVRKLAKDLGVDLFGLSGTGPNGSITRDDVQQAIQQQTSTSATPSPVRLPSFGPDREQRIPVKGVRKLTAENMVASAFTAPHVTEFLTVDVTRSMRALDRLRELSDWRGVRVSPLLLVAKAVLVAIKRYPMVNSSWNGDEIVVKEYVNLGIAAATERGLIVPNIKDAGRLTLRELADAMTALVGTAKEGRTSPADMTAGTFTITNVGVFGVDTGTPILPPGEAAILAFGAVREMPWVHKGKIKVRQVTTLGLSFDHRIIDGELGSKFLRDVGAFLSDPEAALLAWG